MDSERGGAGGGGAHAVGEHRLIARTIVAGGRGEAVSGGAGAWDAGPGLAVIAADHPLDGGGGVTRGGGVETGGLAGVHGEIGRLGGNGGGGQGVIDRLRQVGGDA